MGPFQHSSLDLFEVEPPCNGDDLSNHTGLIEPFLQAADKTPQYSPPECGSFQLNELLITDNTSTDKGKAQWTIAIDLAVNLENAGPNGRMGAEDKINRLKELKDATKGKPVVIIAQAVMPKGGATASDKKEVTLKRYRISDGKIEELSQTPSKGLADDLSDLLAIATHDYPSTRLGLVVNAHGLGNRGLIGDTGQVTLAKFEQAVKTGLSESGREKLDLLDFDACLMAEHTVLDKIGRIAERMVASAEVENTDAETDVDGQNLNKWLEALLQDPSMDGEKLGRKLIETADAGANDARDAKGTRGTPTLALFNLGAEAPFRKSLDDLGDRLAKALENLTDKNSIHEIIDELPTFGTMGGFIDPTQTHERDLKTFLTAMERAIQSKQLPDADGSLIKSIRGAQEQLAKMTEAFHGADQQAPTAGLILGPRERQTYKELGGLSAFLPSRAVLDIHTEAVRQTSINSLFWCGRASDGITVRRMNAAEIPKRYEAIEKELRDQPETLKYWQKTAKPAIENLQRHINSPEKEFIDAITAVQAAAEKLSGMQPFAKQIEAYKSKFDPKQLYEKEEVNGDKGWNKFLNRLNHFKSP